MSTGGAYKGVRDQGKGEFRKHLKTYDPKGLFSNGIVKACGFDSKFKTWKTQAEPLKALDAMSGPGKLGELVANGARAAGINIQMHYNDVDPKILEKATADDALRIALDVTEVGSVVSLGEFQLAAVRYGIKDIPRFDQPVAFNSLYLTLARGGRLVVADMYSTKSTQSAVIAVHSAKQKLAGRDELNEGKCYIPTLSEWKAQALNAGFKSVKIPLMTVSQVDTLDWINQFGGDEAHGLEMVKQMNDIICAAATMSKAFKERFHVKFEGERVKLEFPIMVMVADS